jgi:glycosyltransferase involved in cell wall biosynthesis
MSKVAILLPNLRGGGAERVAWACARELAGRGHQVDLIVAEAKGDLLSIIPKGVRVVDLQAHRLVAALPPLVRYLREEQPDTLQALMWPLTVIAVMAHRLAQSPARLVLSEHTMLSLHVRGRFQQQLLKWTTRLFYPLADVRTACSNLAAEDLSQLSGMRRDRFDVLYNPVSPPARIASTPEVEALWGQASARLITVGSLKPEKNHALLLRAFARIADRQTKLMILGEGDLRIELERLAAELGIADRVLLPGFALDPWPYLASADLFVLSSDYEGFPLVLAEAMHAGLRIVSTDCKSGPAEMTDNGRFGRLVPCGDVDALARAIDAALKEEARPEEVRAQADRVAGAAAIERYSRLLA